MQLTRPLASAWAAENQITSANEDTLEFSVGDCVTVKLTDDERRELLG